MLTEVTGYMQIVRILLAYTLCFQAVTGSGKIKLPKLLSDGAILQRAVDLKLWGWASPAERVDLHFNGTTFSTRTDEQGRWQITLPAQEAGGPHVMVFKGENEIKLRNILFGEVWLCSGQSNMELTMHRVRDKYPDIISTADNPHIRQFLVPDQYDFIEPHEDLEAGQWMEVSPETIEGFSAVAYFFARELYARYQIPVGLINAALGGSPVEAWMSEDALKEFPYAYSEHQRFKDKKLIQEIEAKDSVRQQSWYEKLHRTDRGLSKGAEWYRQDFDDSDWLEMKVPGFWADQGLGQIDGAVWFRKKVVLPGKMAGKEAKLWLGRIVDQDSVYVNGQFVGTTGYQYPPRKYVIPAGLLRAGENSIAVRVINEQGKGGFVPDKPYFIAVQNDTIGLQGNWKIRLGTTLPPLASATFIRWKAGGLYNKMIAPLLPYRIKGVLWYQGESNADEPESYFRTFPALIKNWREKWQQGDFPFLYVQLANFMEESDQPVESNWAELRQAQLSALSLPNTGMAVTIDLGEWNDIHPLNKEDVGKRLALLARRLAYGEPEAKTPVSPIPGHHHFGRKKVTINFLNAPEGLIAKNGQPLQYFEISSNGKDYHKAKAVIRNKKVIVWNEQIRKPVAIRYAWADNPSRANLYSSDGLPASPFQISKRK